MIFYFDIEDRNGVMHAILDPVGWDGTTLILERDSSGKHGVFFQFQAEPYTYDGIASQLLRKEYEQYGIEGKMYLHISYDCGAGIETFDRFRFNFQEYEDMTGEECSVTIPIESEDDAMVLRNRIDQKVNLQTLVAFDGVTALPAYAALPFEKTLPSKGILVTDHSKQTAAFSEEYFGQSFDGEEPTDPTWKARQVAFSVPGFQTVVASEIGGYYTPVNNQPEYDAPMDGANSGWGAPYPAGWIELPYWNGVDNWDRLFPFEEIPPIINYDASLGPDYGPINLTIEGRYNKEFLSMDDPIQITVPVSEIERVAVYMGILKGGYNPASPSSWVWLSPGTPTGSANWNVMPYTGVKDTGAVNGTFNFTFNVTLNPGDRLYYFDKVAYRKKDTNQFISALNITQRADTYFKATAVSYTPATTAKLFMLYEAMSRVVEAISNDKMRVVSFFFGRTDGQPYAAQSDGCGSWTAITQGLFIREMEKRLPNRPPVFALSLKDIYDNINPLYNIGIGMEPDTQRPGFNAVRIDPWWAFYQQSIVLRCTGVGTIRRTIRTAEHVSIFKFGYSKWEAEQYNGIDEFNTTREYRTTLTQVNSTFTQLSNFISSGFASEVTRRLGGASSQDWRYDKDTFIYAMKRVSGVLQVQVGDVGNPSNIVDPNTAYNWRIRPSTMALYWLPRILASYKQATVNSEIIFTDGTGNFYASGFANSNCVIEGKTIAENENLSPSDMGNPSEGLPVWELERATYQWPMTLPQFKDLRSHPADLIYFENDNDSGEGWIDRVEYKVNDGIATFTLIPAR